MAKRSKKPSKTQTKSEEFVVVTFVEDVQRAKEYEALLKSNDIPAIIQEQKESEEVGTNGIAVMVPEGSLDEAHVVIESQDAYDDFYDFALEDEEGEDFDSEFFDDDFDQVSS
ncbi:MAG: hypothetical protein ACYS0I_05040 [Planctomycetota bacterium]